LAVFFNYNIRYLAPSFSHQECHQNLPPVYCQTRPGTVSHAPFLAGTQQLLTDFDSDSNGVSQKVCTKTTRANTQRTTDHYLKRFLSKGVQCFKHNRRRKKRLVSSVAKAHQWCKTPVAQTEGYDDVD